MEQHSTSQKSPLSQVFSCTSVMVCHLKQLINYKYFWSMLIKVKNDHRSIFSNLSNWKEEAWKKSGLQRAIRLLLSNCLNWKKITAMIILHLHLQPQFKMNYFIYTSHHFTPHGRYELNKLTSLPMCGFIAQNAEVTGSNPVEALIFFRFLLSNCLNWKIYCDDHSSLSFNILFEQTTVISVSTK